MDINEIYTTCNYISNKHKSGNAFTPNQFNSITEILKTTKYTNWTRPEKRSIYSEAEGRGEGSSVQFFRSILTRKKIGYDY